MVYPQQDLTSARHNQQKSPLGSSMEKYCIDQVEKCSTAACTPLAVPLVHHPLQLPGGQCIVGYKTITLLNGTNEV
jgi:hypothetical protein